MSGLTSSERRSLDEDGYVLFRGILATQEIEALREALSRAAGGVPDRGGTRHVEGLERADPAFRSIAAHIRSLSVARHVLGRPFQLFQFASREPQPGFGGQGLHTDWVARMPAEPYSIATAIWMLDDFTTRNGATRLVPGSHRNPRPVPRMMSAPGHRHPGQVLVTAAAGSVLIFNGHVWHSGTRNESEGPRRALQCQYLASDRMPPGREREQ